MFQFVSIYEQWASGPGSEDRSVAGFLSWLVDECHTHAGDSMTDSELEVIMSIAGEDPANVDEALMATAWP